MRLPSGTAHPRGGRAGGRSPGRAGPDPGPRARRRRQPAGRAEVFPLEVCGSVCVKEPVGFYPEGSRLGTSGAGALASDIKLSSVRTCRRCVQVLFFLLLLFFFGWVGFLSAISRSSPLPSPPSP